MTSTSASTSASTPVFAIPDLRAIRQALPAIRRTVAHEHVAVLRGLVPAAEVRAALARLRSNFDPRLDTTVDHKSQVARPHEVPSYQRLMLGEWGAGETEHAMFMRCFYNPLHAADTYGMHATFRTLTRVRNLLQGVDEEFCLEQPEDGLYTLSRIHQYPGGGGFLKSHVDSTAAAVPGSAGLEGFFQLLLVMSQKGTDFESGGGYYVIDGERVYYEDDCEPGDVLIYSGHMLHGVEAVDSHLPATLHSSRGRYSALVTLYRCRQEPEKRA